MTRLTWAVGWIGLLAGAAAAGGTDLATIDRSIRKEPAYQSKAPKYCLVVFGPEAKTRVWLVLDGDDLYVDRNADGDLTGAGEKVKVPAFEPDDHPFHEGTREVALGEVKDGDLVHKAFKFSQLHYRRKLGKGGDPSEAKAAEWQAYLDKNYRQTGDGITSSLSIDLQPKGRSGTVHWYAWVDTGGQLVFGGSPRRAPVIHFGGPLTMLSNPSNTIRHTPTEDDRFSVHVGTAGIGPGSFAYMTYDDVPKGVHPAIDVEFPPESSGGTPVKKRYELKERC
jgi:hypothetical protein